MSFDLIVKGGTLPDGRTADIGIAGETIAAIEPRLEAEAGRIIDAAGDLIAPPFVDPHFHMDATLSYGLPRINASGTLLEGIALWGELKPLLTHEAIKERALAYCDWAAAMGLLAIRTHVDVCDDRLLAAEALLEVKREVAPAIDLQLVAFPQDGLYRSPGAGDNLRRALDLGVDVVGGIPHFERTMADGTRSVTELCQLAAERGLIPLKVDDSSGGMSRAHAEIHLVNWDVTVVDRGSTNGTRTRLPGYRDWVRLTPNQPMILLQGTEVMIGSRVLRYEPAAPPPFGG